MVGLAILLSVSGSGHYVEGPLYGRWAGERIAIVGEYYGGSLGEDDFGRSFDEDELGSSFDEEDFTADLHMRIFEQEGGWIDIGEHVRALLEQDWKITFPPSRVDGAKRRSVINADGTLTLLPLPGEAR